MITPSYSITATERVLPNLALDFTTASLDARVTLTRALNTATVTNSSGNIVGINADLPRFDYNPTTLICKGLLIEDARTNVLVNSLIDGTNLTTQIVATTAVAYTLSFYGTGNIVLSGTSSSTQTGSGAYPSRKTYTFTPTVGALTLTVSGTVQYAQLEVGSFATSFIPTTIATLRNADVATMTGANFSSWYNASEGSIVCTYDTVLPIGSGYAYSISNGSTNTFIGGNVTSGNAGVRVDNTTNQALLLVASYTVNTQVKTCLGYKVNSFVGAGNGLAVLIDNAGTIPTVDRMHIGTLNGVIPINGHIAKLAYYPQRLINNEVQAFSK